MTDAERARRARELAHGAIYPYRLRPNSPRWNEFDRLMAEIIAPDPTPDPDPDPEPIPRYAPRAYNWTPSADARFCCSPEYGCARFGAGWIDAKGIQYDEAGRDLGGRTRLEVPDLKGANSMDGREPCETYLGPTGRMIGGTAGYPPASFER